MAENSKIEWTKHTFNPWRGCTKVSPGCANCYAEKMSKRNPSVLGVWGDAGTRVVAAESYWRQPLAWDRAAKAAGERHRVFCASLADVFEDRAELVQPRVRLFHLISETPHLDWLLLTKRPGNVRRFCGGDGVPRSWSESMPPNVWLGTSVEDQARAEERIPLLLQTPAAVRFLSCEPLLGPVDLGRAWRKYVDAEGIVTHSTFADSLNECWNCAAGENQDDSGFDCSVCHGSCTVLKGAKIDWVIVGGESGHGARPMELSWAGGIVEQCKAAGVACFVKQLGSDWATKHNRCSPLLQASMAASDSKGGNMEAWPESLLVRHFPEGANAKP